MYVGIIWITAGVAAKKQSPESAKEIKLQKAHNR
jgi:hypothetical protein